MNEVGSVDRRNQNLQHFSAIRNAFTSRKRKIAELHAVTTDPDVLRTDRDRPHAFSFPASTDQHTFDGILDTAKFVTSYFHPTTSTTLGALSVDDAARRIQPFERHHLPPYHLATALPLRRPKVASPAAPLVRPTSSASVAYTKPPEPRTVTFADTRDGVTRSLPEKPVARSPFAHSPQQPAAPSLPSSNAILARKNEPLCQPGQPLPAGSINGQNGLYVTIVAKEKAPDKLARLNTTTDRAHFEANAQHTKLQHDLYGNKVRETLLAVSHDTSKGQDMISSPSSTTQTANTPAVYEASSNTSPDNDGPHDGEGASHRPGSAAAAAPTTTITTTTTTTAAAAEVVATEASGVGYDGIESTGPCNSSLVPGSQAGEAPNTPMTNTSPPHVSGVDEVEHKSNTDLNSDGPEAQLLEEAAIQRPNPAGQTAVFEGNASDPASSSKVNVASSLDARHHTPQQPEQMPTVLNISGWQHQDAEKKTAKISSLPPPVPRIPEELVIAAINESLNDVVKQEPELFYDHSTNLKAHLFDDTPHAAVWRKWPVKVKFVDAPKIQEMETHSVKHETVDDYLEPLFTRNFANSSSTWMKLSDQVITNAHKTVTTEDFMLAMYDDQSCRTLRRIYDMQLNHHWALRQPERAPEPPRQESWWDVVLKEAKWLRKDYRQERKWKMQVAKTMAYACVAWIQASHEERVKLQVKAKAPPPRWIPVSEVDEQDTVDTVATDDIDLSPCTIAPSVIFGLPDDQVVFPLASCSLSDDLFKQLPVFQGPLVLPSADSLNPLHDADSHWKHAVVSTSRYIDSPLQLSSEEPPRKRRRLQHLQEDDEYGDVHGSADKLLSSGMNPDTTVALFMPEYQDIVQSLHAAIKSHFPVEPMPPQSFYEFRSPSQWTQADDEKLRSLVAQYSKNWTLIADLMKPASKLCSTTDRRTAWECFERWTMLQRAADDLPQQQQQQQYMRAWSARITEANQAISRMNLSLQQMADASPSGTAVTAPRRRATHPVSVERRKTQRHLSMLSAIRRVFKNRELAVAKAQTQSQAASRRIGPSNPETRTDILKTPSDLVKALHYRRIEELNRISELRARQSQLGPVRIPAGIFKPTAMGQIPGSVAAVAQAQNRPPISIPNLAAKIRQRMPPNASLPVPTPAQVQQQQRLMLQMGINPFGKPNPANNHIHAQFLRTLQQGQAASSQSPDIMLRAKIVSEQQRLAAMQQQQRPQATPQTQQRQASGTQSIPPQTPNAQRIPPQPVQQIQQVQQAHQAQQAQQAQQTQQAQQAQQAPQVQQVQHVQHVQHVQQAPQITQVRQQPHMSQSLPSQQAQQQQNQQVSQPLLTQQLQTPLLKAQQQLSRVAPQQTPHQNGTLHQTPPQIARSMTNGGVLSNQSLAGTHGPQQTSPVNGNGISPSPSALTAASRQEFPSIQVATMPSNLSHYIQNLERQTRAKNRTMDPHQVRQSAYEQFLRIYHGHASNMHATVNSVATATNNQQTALSNGLPPRPSQHQYAQLMRAQQEAQAARHNPQQEATAAVHPPKELSQLQPQPQPQPQPQSQVPAQAPQLPPHTPVQQSQPHVQIAPMLGPSPALIQKVHQQNARSSTSVTPAVPPASSVVSNSSLAGKKP